MRKSKPKGKLTSLPTPCSRMGPGGFLMGSALSSPVESSLESAGSPE